MTIEQANEYFSSLPEGFAPAEELRAALTADVQKVQFVGVAGTAGKTAAAGLLAAILREAAFHVGFYRAGCEPLSARIAIGGVSVDPVLLCQAAEALNAAKPLPREAAELAAAARCFGAAGCKLAVVELPDAGLASALPQMPVCAVTAIGPDGVSRSVERLAALAAGVMRKDAVCVTAPEQPKAVLSELVVAAAKADDVLVMETTGSADKCIDGNDKAFRICFYDSYQGTAAADYLTDNALATEVGVFYQSDNDYSVGLYNAFVAECQNTGVTIKETQTFTTATNTDFSTQVNALASSGVKVVFIPIYAEEASTFLTQAKGKFADDVYFFGADGLDGILGKVSQDVTIADNVLMMTPFAADSADPKVQAFVKAYQDTYNATPDQFAADAYDAVYAVKAAVEAANGSTSGADLAAVMPTITVEGVTGTMTWSADGNTNKAASAILYKNGVGTLFGQDNANDAAGAESGDAADTAADAEA